MRRYTLELTVFICGAITMIIEIAGARLVAPYLGTSITVWSSLIGIVLGSLSAGYWLGGKLADQRPQEGVLSAIILSSAVATALIVPVNAYMVPSAIDSLGDLRSQAVSAAILLFVPSTFLLGMISPYAAKLKLKALETSAQTIGNLYAISTLGSITGTFLAGFVLIQYVGTRSILMWLAFALALTSIIVYAQKLWPARTAALVLIAALSISSYPFPVAGATEVSDSDTRYSRVLIYDKNDTQNNKTIREMLIGNEHSSARYLDSDELVYEYTKFYDLANHFNPDINKGLLIGGAGFSYARHFLATHPNASLDVAEIDPGVTDLARDFFGLTDNARLTIHHQDGRIFLNQAAGSYDAIYGDAFQSYSPPFQLTTVEAARRMHDILSEQGVVVLNIISTLKGSGSDLLYAEYNTYKEVFPQVYIIPVYGLISPESPQNVMVVALKSSTEPSWIDSDPEQQARLDKRLVEPFPALPPVLTDDFAPTDRYMMPIQ